MTVFCIRSANHFNSLSRPVKSWLDGMSNFEIEGIGTLEGMVVVGIAAKRRRALLISNSLFEMLLDAVGWEVSGEPPGKSCRNSSPPSS